MGSGGSSNTKGSAGKPDKTSDGKSPSRKNGKMRAGRDEHGRASKATTTPDLGASAQALIAAAGETFANAVGGFQERMSQTFPQNVTLIWGGGSSTNITVPWKGIGLYLGGLVSGLVVAGALLTIPYAELGSPGLRKSLTLFENVLLDIDQVSW